MKLKDIRLVVITGAGSGIGRATAQRFARNGARVIVSDIDAIAAEETVAAIAARGGTAYSRHLDVTDEAEFDGFASWVRAEHGVPDVVVNNAGIGMLGEVIVTNDDDWDRIIGVNLLGAITGTRIFAKQMVDADRPGHIVNVASAAAFLPIPNLASYSTTKYAVKMLTDCVRQELSPTGIGMSAICPGIIKTGIFAAADHPGASDDDAGLRSQAANAVTDLLHRFRLIPGPDSVARSVELAVRFKLGTVLVRPDALAVYALRRISPATLRGAANLIFGPRTLAIVFRAIRRPAFARLLSRTARAD